MLPHSPIQAHPQIYSSFYVDELWPVYQRVPTKRRSLLISLSL